MDETNHGLDWRYCCIEQIYTWQWAAVLRCKGGGTQPCCNQWAIWQYQGNDWRVCYCKSRIGRRGRGICQGGPVLQGECNTVEVRKIAKGDGVQ
jgi:hypothetical protein